MKSVKKPSTQPEKVGNTDDVNGNVDIKLNISNESAATLETIVCSENFERSPITDIFEGTLCMPKTDCDGPSQEIKPFLTLKLNISVSICINIVVRVNFRFLFQEKKVWSLGEALDGFFGGEQQTLLEELPRVLVLQLERCFIKKEPSRLALRPQKKKIKFPLDLYHSKC